MYTDVKTAYLYCTNASVGCCRTPTSSTASPPWARRGPAWSVMQKVRRQNNYTAITRAEQLGRMKSGKWGMKYFLAELKYFLGDQTTRHAEEEPHRVKTGSSCLIILQYYMMSEISFSVMNIMNKRIENGLNCSSSRAILSRNNVDTSKLQESEL